MTPIAATRKPPVGRPKILPPISAKASRPAPVGSGHDTLARVLEAARRSAELASLDRIALVVEAGALAHCAERFDAPACCNDALRRTLTSIPPWDPA